MGIRINTTRDEITAVVLSKYLKKQHYLTYCSQERRLILSAYVVHHDISGASRPGSPEDVVVTSCRSHERRMRGVGRESRSLRH